MYGEGNIGCPQAGQDAKGAPVGVEKGAHPGQGDDEVARGGAVKEEPAYESSRHYKGQAEEEPQGKAAEEDLLYDSLHSRDIPGDLDLRHCGQQHSGDGVCHGGGKEDAGEGHARQDAVGASGLPGAKAEGLKLYRDGDGLHALQDIEEHTAAGERDCQGEDLPQSLFVCPKGQALRGGHVPGFAQISQAVQGGGSLYRTVYGASGDAGSLHGKGGGVNGACEQKKTDSSRTGCSG